MAADSGTLQAPAATSGSTLTATTAAPQAPKLAWDLLHRRYNSWHGATGGLGLVDASTGAPGAVRIQLGLDFFSGSDYLRDGDEIDFRSQTLSVSITPLQVLELFATTSNRSVSRGDDGPLDSLGDYMLGVKVAGHLAPSLWLSGDLRAQLGGEEGGSGQAWDATSVGLRAAFSVDLNELKDPVPFIGRLNVGYWFDSSANIVDEEESRRYENLADPEPKDDETQHLISRFERLAFGINRLDELSFGVGFELPLQIGENFFLHPMAEWQVGIPINRQGYDCPFFLEDSRSGSRSTDNDSCFERHSGVVPMNLSFGVRVVPPLRGLSILLGADIALSGTDRFVRELAPNLPYRVLVAVGYDYDARPTPERIVTVVQTVPQPAAAPVAVAPTGRVRGVVSANDGLPVAGVVITFADRQLTALSSAVDGTFVTEALAPGQLQFNLTHPDYESGVCPTAIPATGGDASVRCALLPKPKVGVLSGRVTDAWGGPLPGARVVLTGPSGTLLTSNTEGAFEAPGMLAGEYGVRVEASGYFARQTKVQIASRERVRIDVSLTRKLARPSIIVQPDSSVEAPTIVWTGESLELTSAGEAAVAELADLLLVRADLSVRIQGYGSEWVARPRAELIKQRLVAAGVDARRVEALGGGKRLRITLRP